MGKIGAFFDQILNDFIAVFLSIGAVMLSFGICYWLFGEDSSLLAYFATMVIMVILGGFGSAYLIRIVAKQHKVPVLLVFALLLIALVISVLIAGGDFTDSILFLFSQPYNSINAGILGIFIVGVLELIVFFVVITEYFR